MAHVACVHDFEDSSNGCSARTPAGLEASEGQMATIIPVTLTPSPPAIVLVDKRARISRSALPAVSRLFRRQ